MLISKSKIANTRTEDLKISDSENSEHMWLRHENSKINIVDSRLFGCGLSALDFFVNWCTILGVMFHARKSKQM